FCRREFDAKLRWLRVIARVMWSFALLMDVDGAHLTTDYAFPSILIEERPHRPVGSGSFCRSRAVRSADPDSASEPRPGRAELMRAVLVQSCEANSSSRPESRVETIGEQKFDFAELFETYRKPVLKLCLHLTGNTTDAEDAFQAAFLAIYEALPTF